MSWADRKAYALRSLLIDVLRDVDPSTADYGIAGLETNTLKLAEQVCDPSSTEQEPLDAFLNGAVEKALSGAVATYGASAAIDSIRQHLRTRAAGIVCATCADGEICRGRFRSDDRIVSAPNGGLCIGNIKRAFETASMTAKQVYSDILTYPHPMLVLATEGASHLPGLLPASVRIAANGTTTFDDQGDAKSSRILVTVAPLAYNRLTAAALPYVLLHEVLCHGFQMARKPLPRPDKRAITDPVSEGMVDAIVVEILTERADGDNELSPIEASLKHSEAAVAAQIHLARRSRDVQPRFPEADAVALGATAYHLIKKHLAAGGDQDHSIARRLAFSLNAHEWEFGDRLTGISQLVSSFRSPRDVRTLRLLDDFQSDFDVQPLIQHLGSHARL